MSSNLRIHFGHCEATNKKMYLTKSDAKKIAKITRTHKKLSCFRCLACGYFHIGSKGKFTRAQHRAHRERKFS